MTLVSKMPHHNCYCNKLCNTVADQRSYGRDDLLKLDNISEHRAGFHERNQWICETHTTFSVADPGFPRGGAPTLRGAPTYDFAKFSQKLHEIERIWTRGGGGTRPKFYYVDPPLVLSLRITVTLH